MLGCTLGSGATIQILDLTCVKICAILRFRTKLALLLEINTPALRNIDRELYLKDDNLLYNFLLQMLRPKFMERQRFFAVLVPSANKFILVFLIKVDKGH